MLGHGCDAVCVRLGEVQLNAGDVDHTYFNESIIRAAAVCNCHVTAAHFGVLCGLERSGVFDFQITKHIVASLRNAGRKKNREGGFCENIHVVFL